MIIRAGQILFRKTKTIHFPPLKVESIKPDVVVLQDLFRYNKTIIITKEQLTRFIKSTIDWRDYNYEKIKETTIYKQEYINTDEEIHKNNEKEKKIFNKIDESHEQLSLFQ